MQIDCISNGVVFCDKKKRVSSKSAAIPPHESKNFQFAQLQD